MCLRSAFIFTFSCYVCLSAVGFAGEHWLTLTWWPCVHSTIMCACLLLHLQVNIDCDIDLVTMCTFNHSVCLSAVVCAGEHWLWLWPSDHYVCLSVVTFAGEHWLWLWPGDHVYIQPLCVPVCCCVYRRTLTVTLTWWPCIHSTITCACLLLHLQENIDCDFDLVTSSPAALVTLLDQAPQQGLVSTYLHFHGSDSLSGTLSFFQGALMR